nr:hypothetical protein [Neobacillus sp. Marseille-Q6967]
MKKLCIAVIVLSFLGFGPLKSLFYDESNPDRTQLPIAEKVKNKNELEAIQSFLIVEKNQSLTSPAYLLKYNSTEKALRIASLEVPSREENQLTFLKKYIEETYNEKINYSIVVDTQRMAKIIDKMLPNGLNFIPKDNEHGEPATYKGEDITNFITNIQANPDSSQNLQPILMQLKEEILNNVSPEEIITFIPEIMDSVSTDIGKGKIMDLGLTLLMDPVTSIKPLELVVNKGTEEVSGAVQHIF